MFLIWIDIGRHVPNLSCLTGRPPPTDCSRPSLESPALKAESWRHCPRHSKKNSAAGKPGAESRKPKALPVHPWSKQHGVDCGSLRGAQIFRGRFAGPAICNDVKGNLLSLVEGTHAGAFDSADMNENIWASLVRLNKAETLLAVKPLHSSRIHGRSSFKIDVCLELRSRTQQANFEIWGGSSVRRAMSGKAKSFGRNSIDHTWLLFDHFASGFQFLWQ
jgi:hypothetical protein